ncbi:endoplasmic reticulum protein [Rhizoctonia solani 123E]|uniref:Endoplasmic reticulum protein n=1 Tax=Rhizoctonia solani 123E TaxID=1423351 RepID=A0A074S5E4_9AGAM|nr:endoplasmic reticulum protein [Rhizoctonia solani 123E]
MEANRDDALKSLRLARKRFESGNISEARRLADKSISLFPTAEAKEFLSALASAPSPSSPVDTPMASGAETHPSAGGAHNRKGKSKSDSTDGSEKKWTPDQAAVVKRVRSCGATAYYEVLAIEKTADENEVKKAYRKLALQLHPDKNNAPGADEAFKIVSKAFTILSDPQKRTVYDQVGGDPEQRGGGGGAASSGMGGMHMRPGFNPMFFDEEINPEDVFNMFFGASGFGGPGFSAGFGNSFGGGPMFSASFGGPRIRVQRFGAPRRPAGQQRTTETSDTRSIFVQLLPLIALLAISLFSSLFSFITTGGTPSYPAFRYDQSGSFKVERSTSRFDVPYFVSPKEWAEHPIGKVAEQIKAGSSEASTSDRSKLRSFETVVERRYEEHLYDICRHEYEHRERRIDQNKGIFGFGADWEKVRTIQAEKLPHCEKLTALQYKQKTHKQ